jgi:phenylacetic acid degradation operon negative regulatory protein
MTPARNTGAPSPYWARRTTVSVADRAQNEEWGGRKLSARSVIASTLLGVHPPELPAAVLVRSGELFGMRENATRTALSRMVAAGELEATGDAAYRLAGHLLERQARQDVSRRPPQRRWRDGWHVAVVVADRRSAADRTELRSVLRRARFGELREGVWTRPDNLGDHPATAGCTWAAATWDEAPLHLWDLGGWAARAADLETAMAHDRRRLEGEGVAALADAFVLSAAVLRHLQADPLLPAELLPAGWPGGGLRAAYDGFDETFTSVWREWHRSVR